jgi:hypothetical protein
MNLNNVTAGNGKVRWRLRDIVFAVSIVADLAAVVVMLYVCIHFQTHPPISSSSADASLCAPHAGNTDLLRCLAPQRKTKRLMGNCDGMSTSTAECQDCR